MDRNAMSNVSKIEIDTLTNISEKELDYRYFMIGLNSQFLTETNMREQNVYHRFNAYGNTMSLSQVFKDRGYNYCHLSPM